MCTAFCAFQHINALRDPAAAKRKRLQAIVHLEFCCRLYQYQSEGGRYFLHEHPASASSWREECIQRVKGLPGVDVVVGDQCQYGQRSQAAERPVKKPTRWMSNSPHLLESLGIRCHSGGGFCSATGTRHWPCTGTTARQAAIYPFQLCKAILTGFRAQLGADGIWNSGEEGLHYANESHSSVRGGDEDEPVQSGQPLCPELVKRAREVELEFFRDKCVWVKRHITECVARTGHMPVSVKWVDCNKGDDENPNYRSRLVARQFRMPGEDAVFAPTPPLEALRTILSLAATRLKGDSRLCRDPTSNRRIQISLLDVKRAYFNASCSEGEPTYVQLPPEDPDAAKGMCGLLLKHMYGTKKAAEAWQLEYSATLKAMGFKQGVASPCVFVHKQRSIVTSVHGDDFTNRGSKEDLDWMETELEKKYELSKGGRLGPGPDDAKEGTVLNRVVRWTADGLEYEADPRQAEKLVADLGLNGANSIATPGARPTNEQPAAAQALESKLHTPFKSHAARGNYLASDRPDVQFSAKEICRFMSTPTDNGDNALKKLGRYLIGRPRLVMKLPWQEASEITVYTDTDWAGCPRTRKSTSGGCIKLGCHTIKTWSSTQPSVSLSSGEAEFYGVVKGAGIGLGYQSLLRDLGYDLPMTLYTDSTAAMGVCNRQGLGQLRHIATHTLWVQEKVQEKAFTLRKVSVWEGKPSRPLHKVPAQRRTGGQTCGMVGWRVQGWQS